MTHVKAVCLSGVVLLLGLTIPSSARGQNGGKKPEKCEQTVARAGGAYLAQHLGVLRRCERLRLQGILAADVDCLEGDQTAAELEGIRRDLQNAIGRACGGADKTCGTGDDMTPTEFGWGNVTQCPDIDNSGCTGAISSCADVTTCIECSGAAASRQAVELIFEDFDPVQFGTDSDANFCQLAIGKAATKFLQVSARALAKCWIARIQGKDDGDCPDGTGKDGDMIAKAEAKKQKVICKACGGPDKACGGADDLSVADFGFGSDCPAVSVPSGGSCGGAILDVPDVVDCVDCVAKFKAECMARLGAPGVGPYPAECNPGGGLCGNGVVDPGEECDPSSPGGSFCAPGTTCTDQCVCEGGGSTTTTTTTTPGSTTTAPGGLCGNGVVDPGEECDPASPDGGFPGSPGGGFCAPGTTCTAQCVCAGGSTTTCSSTTTTVVTTTTTTAPGGLCGNGVLDPGEECDMSSPAGSFLCPPGCTCDSLTCTCVPIGGSTTTTTTPPAGCGNGIVDPGEECDPSSPSGALLCAIGTNCGVGCTCVGATTTSTSLPGVTTTTPTGTTVPVTTTTQPGGAPAFLDFTTSLSDEVCGAYFADVAGTEDEELDELTCGGLNIGGGFSTVLEGPTPDGSTSRFTVVGCTGNSCTLGSTNTAGPGRQCTNTGCNFGTPLPIPNGGLSTCVANTFAAPAAGTVDIGTGVVSVDISLSSRVILTGNDAQPCPICRSGSVSGAACAGSPGSPCTGVCQGSPNQGDPCVSTNSEGLSTDCPIPAAQPGTDVCYGGTNNGVACGPTVECVGGGTCSTLVGSIPVNLSPLTTGTATRANPNGNFCAGQTNAGCFGDEDCRSIRETGAAAGPLSVGTPAAVTLASVFCIPASGSPLIDFSASLPGPGATSLPGTLTLVP